MADKCSILFEDDYFHLSNDKVSYIMELRDNAWLLHRYWGPRITNYAGGSRPDPVMRSFAAPADGGEDPLFSFEMLPQEFSVPDNGDFREAMIAVRNEEGTPASRFRYESFEISDGLRDPESMPHIRAAEGSAKTLSIRFKDAATSTVLVLNYTIIEGIACIIRSATITNESLGPLRIERALSALLDMPYEGRELVTFHGSHMKEFQIDRRPITHGTASVGSVRGASGPQYPAFAALCTPEATEHTGVVHACQLIYSGNHTVRTERDQYNNLRMVIGISPNGFSWKLNPGESFDTPQAVFVCSTEGFNGMSGEFYSLYTDRLFPPQWAKKTRPILLNSWEAFYFDVDERKMLDLITEAARFGFELVVLDDGWFGRRVDSKSSLGDWNVNLDKFPNGLTPLLDRAKECGVGFGIWFEPEMISPDSDLMRAHPDWAASFPGVKPLLSRNQLVLDLTRTEIQDYVIGVLTNFLNEYPVSYIKWDMNRHITDPGSKELLPDRRGEFCHRYMLGLYRILSAVTEKFPDVLFENCSSGGGRFDPGMSFYMPQTWCSDDSDALDREYIQYGASYTFPPSAVTAHVSAVPNHQTGRRIPFETRADVASSANMGYELNIMDIPNEEREKVVRHIAEYKKERDLIFDGEFFRLRSPFEGDICAWMLTDRERERAIVYAFTPAYDNASIHEIIKVPYLNPDTLYVERDSGKVYSGSELRHAGLWFSFEKGDYPARKFVFHAV